MSQIKVQGGGLMDENTKLNRKVITLHSIIEDLQAQIKGLKKMREVKCPQCARVMTYDEKNVLTEDGGCFITINQSWFCDPCIEELLRPGLSDMH
jgi:hypothetical protein